MKRERAYPALCLGFGALVLLAGAFFTLSAFNVLRPLGTPPGPIPLGPGGVYYLGFTGTALIGWAAGLIAAARNPEAARIVGPLSALVLALMAAFRMFAWLWGDYHSSLGELPRYEALVFLPLAIAFLWLRPSPADSARSPLWRRWLATAAIAALVALDLWLPVSEMAGRRDEARLRSDVAELAARIGDRLPPLGLQDLRGDPLSLADFRGHPTLVTFERSVDW